LIVIVIIAILIGFIMLAAGEAQARANERATQSLIQKLETGLNDRLEALLQNRPEPNFSHAYMATLHSPVFNRNVLPVVDPNTGLANTQIKSELRAQAVATFDFIKSELPDVFTLDPQFLQNPNSYNGPYPCNFAGVPFAPQGAGYADPNGAFGGNLGSGNLYQYVLPLGHAVLGPARVAPAPNPNAFLRGDGEVTGGFFVSSNPSLGLTGSGIFGASYVAAAGIYKNLGYLPLGYDGIDNGGIAGLVDDWQEGLTDPTSKQVDPVVAPLDNPTAPQSDWKNLSFFIRHRLSNHTHKTARAEMLYAILVEGSGPWGSVFSRDDFTDRQVKDTDGDGLPEFIDAWGEPLQFFRWPVLYHSDFQKGQVILPDTGTPQTWDLVLPYTQPWEQRERDALDPNSQLTAPSWWRWTNNNPQSLLFNPGNQALDVSGSVLDFEHFFHRLTEPIPPPGRQPTLPWDLSASLRRAFYSKALILSGGSDLTPGVFLYSDTALNAIITGPNGARLASSAMIYNENNALQFGLELLPGGGFMTSPTIPNAGTKFTTQSTYDPTNPHTYEIQQAGQDDVTNHNVQSLGGFGGTAQ
jgi:hypothetical protein